MDRVVKPHVNNDNDVCCQVINIECVLIDEAIPAIGLQAGSDLSTLVNKLIQEIRNLRIRLDQLEVRITELEEDV